MRKQVGITVLCLLVCLSIYVDSLPAGDALERDRRGRKKQKGRKRLRGSNKTDKSIEGDHADELKHPDNVDPNSPLGRLVASFVDRKQGHDKHYRNNRLTDKEIGESLDKHLFLSESNGGIEDKRQFDRVNRLWPNARVPYTISTSFSSGQRNVILNAFNEMATKTCVQFVPRNGESAYVQFVTGSGCSSYVGKINRPQEVTLGSGCVTNGITLHEMMHAINMHHEQSRADRDAHVVINWNNLAQGYQNVNYVKQNTFDRNPFDYASNLQYGLYDFAINRNQKAMSFKNSELEFLAKSATGLSFMDVKDIIDAYGCTAGCPSTSPVCENNGYLNKDCKCICPNYLTGTRCETIITDSGCGGMVDVTTGIKTIQSPNYPSNYPTGTECVWLAKGVSGSVIRMNVVDFDIKDDTTCQHFLEIQYVFVGQRGIARCGQISSLTYTSYNDTRGPTNLMLLRFNTKVASSSTTRKGFRLTVQQIGAAVVDPCVPDPCNGKGSCSDGTCTCNTGWTGADCSIAVGDPCVPDPCNGKGSCSGGTCTCNTGWTGADCSIAVGDPCVPDPCNGNGACSGGTCSCNSGWTGADCSIVVPVTKIACTWEAGNTGCFLGNVNNDQFDWATNSGQTPSVDTGPNAASEGSVYAFIETSSPRTTGQVAILSSGTNNIPSGTSCMSFSYCMYGASMGTLQVVQVVSGQETVLFSESADTGPVWVSSSVELNGNGVTVEFRGITGSSWQSDMALDDITLQSGSCATGCQNSPCKNGGACSTTSAGFTCQCVNGWAGSTCSLLSADVSVSVSFEDQSGGGILINADYNDQGQFPWTVRQGSTPSADTGPSDASDGSSYVYIETSSPRVTGDKATLKTQVNFEAGTRCLLFDYHMYGATINTLRVVTNENQRITELFSRQGSQGNQWLTTSITLDTTEDTIVLFEAVCGSSWNGDIALDNIQFLAGACSVCATSPCSNGGSCTDVDNANGYTCACTAGYSGDTCDTLSATLTLNCGFEANAALPCFFKNTAVNDDFDWTAQQGGTPSVDTGPTGAFEGSIYMYIETSDPRVSGQTAVLTTGDIKFEQSARCLTFNYHMYGSSMGTLRVRSGEKGGTLTTRFQRTGQQNTVNVWNPASVTIPVQTDVQIVIDGERGSSWQGDIAIDNLQLSPNQC